MTKKVFITGISGFAGSHLAEYLLTQNNYEISGTFLFEESLKNIEPVKNRLELLKLDLNDTENVKKVILDVKPDIIFHLAALSSAGDSFKNPARTITNNVSAQINLLEAVKDAKLFNSKILITSSADVYGIVSKEDLPIDEDTPLKPANPYAVSKITQDFLALQYHLSYKMDIIRVRPFNHVGPRQAPNFVISSFAKKIADIEKGNIEPVMNVGNLSSRRDFTDVRDMVKAYLLAIEKGVSGDVYNLGKGESYQIQEILNKLVSLSNTKIQVKVDSSLLRPSDEPELVCDNTKFVKLTGWKTEIPLEKTLKDTLDYWREIV